MSRPTQGDPVVDAIDGFPPDGLLADLGRTP